MRGYEARRGDNEREGENALLGRPRIWFFDIRPKIRTIDSGTTLDSDQVKAPVNSPQKIRRLGCHDAQRGRAQQASLGRGGRLRGAFALFAVSRFGVMAHETRRGAEDQAKRAGIHRALGLGRSVHRLGALASQRRAFGGGLRAGRPGPPHSVFFFRSGRLFQSQGLPSLFLGRRSALKRVLGIGPSVGLGAGRLSLTFGLQPKQHCIGVEHV